MQQPPNQTPVFVVMAAKGGVGKTITSSNLAAALAAETPSRPQRRVLVIDADPQGNQDRALGAPVDTESFVLADALLAIQAGEDELDGYPLTPTNVPGVALLAGGSTLNEISDTLGQAGAAVAGWIKGVIASFAPHYDAIVIDTPAVFTHLTLGALATADLALCVIQVEDSFSTDALELVETQFTELGSAAPPMVLVGQKVMPGRRMWTEIQELFVPDSFPCLEPGADALERLRGERNAWLALIPNNINIRDGATFGEPVVIGRRRGSQAGLKLRRMADDAYSLATQKETVR